jgi:hypothetical protein
MAARTRLRHVGTGVGPRPWGPAPARTRFLPRLRVNADARTFGRKERLDGHFHPKTSFMTSLGSLASGWTLECVNENVKRS